MEKLKKILVTGGAGYIGSHTVVSLINAGFEPVIVDDFSNSEPWILENLTELTGKTIKHYNINCVEKSLNEIFINENLHGVIHFAAFKAVGESVEKPLKYYQNNINSLLCLIELMDKHGVENLVFSSSCTVYGEADYLPVSEDHPMKKAESPYGYTKQVCENIIRDCLKAKKIKNAATLRYFNPIGAHSSGLIGELPIGTPNNLIPFITQTAMGIRSCLTIFGNNYDTPDGTCIRDYIHVMDLADAHVRSLITMSKNNTSFTLNVGTGKGHSVLEVIKSFEQVNQLKLKYKIGPKRDGDIEQIYAATDLVEKTLKWKPKYSLDQAMEDAWRWQKNLSEK